MNWLRISLVSVAITFLVVPHTVLAHHGQAVDSDGDGISNIEDVCWNNKDHYKCLKRAGLWEWPVRAGTWSTPKKKFNSIRTCMDLSDWKNTLLQKSLNWAGITLITLPAATTIVGAIAPGVSIITAGSFSSAHANAEDVYEKLCSSRY